ncbi:MAG: 3-deoxy-D-manno-octulosonic acid transferase [Candidatus Hydrogenedentes bacterium]|nr:3-deoxy-D-manno-octulosonic acid transferase [Candidatus Hydrogenedentota bacterium]
MIAQAFYDIATTAVTPLAAGYMLLRGKHRPLLGRFRPQLPQPAGQPLWLQACSVGETAVAALLLRGLRARWTDLPLFLTVSTVAGRSRAEELASGTPISWFPVDQRVIVRDFLVRLNPRILVLVETEIWPNTIRIAHEQGIPVVLVNARISDKHYPRYLRWRSLFQPAFSRIAAAGAQSDTHAERLISLGVPAGAVTVTGNTKFDGVTTHVDPALQDALKRETGLLRRSPIVVFGSTRPGDEQLAATVWESLKRAWPDAGLVVAPRHIQRTPEIVRHFSEPVQLRSRCKDAPPSTDARVLVLDTLGELVPFYSLADVAVVGGSFYPGVNGHNPLEPAALGVATVFGPYMSNFADPARVLTGCGGATQVSGPDALERALLDLLADAGRRTRLARSAGEAITLNHGATDRTLDLIGDTMMKWPR